MAKKDKAAKKKAGGNKLFDILLIIIGAGLVVVLQVGFIFLLFALLPSLVAFFIDETRRRYVYKTVLACNLSGMLPTLAEFAAHGRSIADLQKVMENPLIWLMVYGSAAAGWALIWVCRAIAVTMVSVTCDQKILILKRIKKEMEEEWGTDVRHIE